MIHTTSSTSLISFGHASYWFTLQLIFKDRQRMEQDTGWNVGDENDAAIAVTSAVTFSCANSPLVASCFQTILMVCVPMRGRGMVEPLMS